MIISTGLAWPKSVQCLREYDAKTFASDLVAGITVGLVALPLAMAFAISSGLTPQAGIYCAIVTGFLISALGGSKVAIGGPTGAFVVVVYGIVQKHGVDGLYTCTLIAGAILVFLGITGIGSAIKFIPRPVVVGFTNGIALLIASTQLKDFFGLTVDKVPGEFVGRMQALAAHASTLSVPATILGLSTVATILLINRFYKRVPGSIVAMAAGTAVAWIANLPLETIGTRFGGIPAGLPQFQIPTLKLDLIPGLISPAVTIAMLGAIESLMSAVVADRLTGDKHNPNTELVGQGIANIFSPMFGGLPATGAIARTATNVRSGGKTPVAGMIHALTLLCVLLFAAPLAAHIPLAVLAGILLVVAYNMGEWSEIPLLLKLTKADISVWAVTFFLTVTADLTVAVEVGMILAALLFIQKVAQTTTVSKVTAEYLASGQAHVLQDKQIPDYAAVFRIHGPFLFGSTDKIATLVEQIDQLPPIVLLRLRNMTAIDATGLAAIEEIAEKLHAASRTLIVCGAREQPARIMKDARFEELVGVENICPNVDAALLRAKVVYDELMKEPVVSG
ncbi:MAG: SulP family inorganic anion transporter [Bryobacteraceae bacterium]